MDCSNARNTVGPTEHLWKKIEMATTAILETEKMMYLFNTGFHFLRNSIDNCKKISLRLSVTVMLIKQQRSICYIKRYCDLFEQWYC